jgi:SAM-dependent methyltransferase
VAAAKSGYRDFYDDVSRTLAATGVGEASFFLNYGYVSCEDADEAVVDVPDGEFNPNSIRLALELAGSTPLKDRQVVDVGCGRGGMAALLAVRLGADVLGIDLSPEAIAFCRRAHAHSGVRFQVGDAEHLPIDEASCDVVTNLESSHTYPDMRAFLGEVRRVLRPGGWFLHGDLLPGTRWTEVRAMLAALGLVAEDGTSRRTCSHRATRSPRGGSRLSVRRVPPSATSSPSRVRPCTSRCGAGPGSTAS